VGKTPESSTKPAIVFRAEKNSKVHRPSRRRSCLELDGCLTFGNRVSSAAFQSTLWLPVHVCLCLRATGACWLDLPSRIDLSARHRHCSHHHHSLSASSFWQFWSLEGHVWNQVGQRQTFPGISLSNWGDSSPSCVALKANSCLGAFLVSRHGFAWSSRSSVSRTPFLQAAARSLNIVVAVSADQTGSAAPTGLISYLPLSEIFAMYVK